ncbi:MAG: Na+/H+ antiporter NhaC family protein [Fusobacterium varium]|nr:Na+/H+ antiporter NhaC family protein [Fusobacterium varium]MDY4005938.1 Na+/H+ antiporter NhaC family protein [Fusobacterium varium]
MFSVIFGVLMGGTCSPVSDISVLFSMIAGADFINHIKTQILYALFNGIISIILFIILVISLTIDNKILFFKE